MAEPIPAMKDRSDAYISQYLFWTMLILGGISGAAGYFILRFFDGLTWYLLAPLLYGVNFICIFLLIYYRQKNEEPVDTRQILRFILKYTGTWIIAYFALGTATFYFGW